MRLITFKDGMMQGESEIPDPPPHPLEAFALTQDLDYVAIRGLFNHENRIRALVRGVRAIATAAERAALDDQDVEPTRADMMPTEFGEILKALT